MGVSRVSYNGYYVSFPRMRPGSDSLYPHQGFARRRRIASEASVLPPDFARAKSNSRRICESKIKLPQESRKRASSHRNHWTLKIPGDKLRG